MMERVRHPSMNPMGEEEDANAARFHIIRDAYDLPLPDLVQDPGAWDKLGKEGRKVEESRRKTAVAIRGKCSETDAKAERKWRKQWPGPLRDFSSSSSSSSTATTKESQERTRRLLKSLCRQGVPISLRPFVWFHASGASTMKEEAGEDQSYQRMCSLEGHPSETLHQIDLDIPRTFPEYDWFQSAEGRSALRNVLVAVSQYSGRGEGYYCQSMNYVAAFLLIALQKDQEKAFWVMVTIMKDKVYVETWGKNLKGCLVEMDTLRTLLKKRVPQVASHLEQIHCDVSYFATDWFLCLFCKTLPGETTARVWDSLLMEGPKVLFRVALTIIKLSRSELMQATNPGDVLVILKRVQGSLHDRAKLMDLAFRSNGSLPMAKIIKYRNRSEHQALGKKTNDNNILLQNQ